MPILRNVQDAFSLKLMKPMANILPTTKSEARDAERLFLTGLHFDKTRRIMTAFSPNIVYLIIAIFPDFMKGKSYCIPKYAADINSELEPPDFEITGQKAPNWRKLLPSGLFDAKLPIIPEKAVNELKAYIKNMIDNHVEVKAKTGGDDVVSNADLYIKIQLDNPTDDTKKYVCINVHFLVKVLKFLGDGPIAAHILGNDRMIVFIGVWGNWVAGIMPVHVKDANGCGSIVLKTRGVYTNCYVFDGVDAEVAAIEKNGATASATATPKTAETKKPTKAPKTKTATETTTTQPAQRTTKTAEPNKATKRTSTATPKKQPAKRTAETKKPTKAPKTKTATETTTAPPAHRNGTTATVRETAAETASATMKRIAESRNDGDKSWIQVIPVGFDNKK